MCNRQPIALRACSVQHERQDRSKIKNIKIEAQRPCSKILFDPGIYPPAPCTPLLKINQICWSYNPGYAALRYNYIRRKSEKDQSTHTKIFSKFGKLNISFSLDRAEREARSSKLHIDVCTYAHMHHKLTQ